MSIEVAIRHRVGAFDLDAAFRSSGRLTALFGPSGSGKSTVVSIIGGLVRPRQGKVVVDGRVLVDTDRRVFVPPHRRRIGYVFQDARLFPHMSVARNIGYGAWFTPQAGRYAKSGEIVDLLGIAHLLDRRPASLSGGEKQRVAIARALAASPRLLLMDEPLSSLDDQRKADILPYIERLRDEFDIPIVYVSHSLTEVARLATDIVLLDHGRVTAFGPATGIMRRLDLLGGEAEAGALLDMRVVARDSAFDVATVSSPAGTMRIAGLHAPDGSRVRLRVRARDVMLALSEPLNISGLNVLKGVVAEVGAPSGPHVDVTVDCNGVALVARITRLSASNLALTPGKQVFAIVKSVSFDPSTTGFATPSIG